MIIIDQFINNSWKNIQTKAPEGYVDCRIGLVVEVDYSIEDLKDRY